MVLRICLESYCNNLSHEIRCEQHRKRNKNLARDMLHQIAARDRWVCQICLRPVEKKRGHHSGAPSIDHVNGDISNDRPSNLQLAHIGCNASKR